MQTPQTRTIKLLPKITQAQTQYYDMDPEDSAWIQHWLTRFLADISELATYHEDIAREYFRRQPRQLPRGRHGPNSIASMIGGIVSQTLQNPRRNLSEPQLDPLELVFEIMQPLYADENLPRIRFERSLLRIQRGD